MNKRTNISAWMNGCWSLSLWLLCLMVMWVALSQQSFFYKQWYHLLDIDKTINEYAPLNRFGRENFAQTSAEEHERLFAVIIHAIHQQGSGLTTIQYSLPGGKKETLLTKQEVIHLQDVADLISSTGRLMKVIAAAFIFSSLLMRYQQIAISSLGQQSLYAGGLSTILLILCLIVGIENVFYGLHTMIFPDDQQWFFYYEDSLMSTLMQAPNIFLPISIVWIMGTWILWSMAVVIGRRV
ncbi:MAG: hypothetical protein ACI8VC_001026 [Candidatus Endobugula sp.]|jgi:hypothetical protein